MSLVVDTKYLLLISSKLDNFKKKTDVLWNFRCPYCMDSKKKSSKSRGYMYRKNNDLFFKCHNCTKGTTMSNFIQSLDPILHKEYVLERFRSGDTHPNHNYKKPVLLSSKTEDIFRSKRKNIYEISGLDPIDTLPDGHFAKSYIQNRKIPKEHWNKLHFTNDFKKFVQSINPEKSSNLKSKDPRIVIPFFDETGSLIAVQGRALEDSVARYITIKTNELNKKIYGLERLNKNNKIWIFEGPIDSLFIPNSLATAGSELTSLLKEFPEATFVFDNEPSNKEITENMSRVIDSGSKIVIWDKENKNKDINDMVLSGMDIHTELESCVYSGLEAKFRFNVWRRL
jgi:hypothetical protein